MTLGKNSANHGHTRNGHKSPEYQSWANMISRTRATTGMSFRYYGSRGIAVCERWRKFENFLADMGSRPDGTTLDRIDNDNGYCKRNCRWATRLQQMRNIRAHIDGSSGVRGVSWDKRLGKWRASICTNYKVRYLGLFDSVEKASARYQQELAKERRKE